MKDSLKVISAFGIPIEIHISFAILMFFIALVSIFSRSLGFFVYISLLFLTVILHELSHSFVALMYGIKIERIVLLPFGGVASMEKMPEDPQEELKISLAGPGLNFVFAILTYLLILLIPHASSRLFPFFTFRLTDWVDMLVLTFKINVLLGAFNLFIPALPMDGGRVLRALLALKMGFTQATDLAAEVAKAIAILMFAFGLFFNWWLIVIAFFVYIGATQEMEATRISALLKGVKVEDIMTKEVMEVSEELSLEEFSDIILRFRHMGYPVTRDGALVGIVTFTDLAKNPKEKWKDLTIKDVMTKDVLMVSPGSSSIDVLMKMTRKGIGRLPVVEGDKVVGIISRSDIIKTAKLMKLRR
jgi:Zn-dependent protease